MGGCCSKLGTYMIRKEEGSNAKADGATPKLSKIEKKQSFIESKAGSNGEAVTNGDGGKKRHGSGSSSSSSSSSEAEAENQPNVTAENTPAHEVMPPGGGYDADGGTAAVNQQVTVTKSTVVSGDGSHTTVVEETRTTTVVSSSTVVTEQVVQSGVGV